MKDLKIRNTPCHGCPYRVDCPSGVWAAEEYERLPEYDAETFNQPPQVFACHDAADRQERDTLCRGWLDCHDKHHSLALRLALSMGHVEPSIYDLPLSGVACFESGQEACDHGKADIAEPTKAARDKVKLLIKKHPDLRD